ncbi:MAG: hypothetical protein M1813_007313 [Trichoglossum hirsutum]|nr:MAG: hypothetical protein M1813_007313 [Trichoglossum hirsutum]
MAVSVRAHNLESDYKLIKPIGKGEGCMNGGIYVVRQKRSGQIFVEKRIKPSEIDVGRREIEILHGLEPHEGIIRCYEAFLTKSPPAAALYFEWCDLGNLLCLVERFSAHGMHIPEQFVWHTFHTLACAISYIHFGIHDPTTPSRPNSRWRTVLHRDIKPNNIFLKSRGGGSRSKTDAYPRVVLGDFGLATRMGMKDFPDVGKYVGTVRWQPPELPYHSCRGEVWSLGAVVHSMCHLDEGPVSRPPHGIKESVWSELPEARRPLKLNPVAYSGELNEALGMCLRFQKNERPMANELVLALQRLARRSRCSFVPLPAWAFG